MSSYVLAIAAILSVGWLVNHNSIISTSSINQNNLALKKKQVVLQQKFTQIKINDVQDNVVLKNGIKYRVYYRGNNQLKPNFTVNKQRLVIKNQSKFVFNFHPQNNSTIIIEMPKNKLKSVSIDTTNGNIIADYLAVEHGNFVSTNGDIRIDDLKIKQGFSINSVNGDVTVKRTNATGYDLNTANGNIAFDKQNMTNNFNLNAESKNLLKISNSNGNIKIK